LGGASLLTKKKKKEKKTSTCRFFLARELFFAICTGGKENQHRGRRKGNLREGSGHKGETEAPIGGVGGGIEQGGVNVKRRKKKQEEVNIMIECQPTQISEVETGHSSGCTGREGGTEEQKAFSMGEVT